MKRVSFALLVVMAAGCSLQPEVGQLVRGCTIESEYERPSAYDGKGPDPRCASTGPTVANECDRCENENCCAERFGCYDDSTCRCADQAFDACLDSAAQEDATSPEAAAERCAADFAASGPAAKARLDCREAACSTECKATRP
jgi:hypothetical protein